MEALKYIELAKSKDESRYNLTSVYRDTHHLVATDGHRLHMSNGLPEARPHFLNGIDAEFPDYKQIIPKQDPVGKIEYHTSNNGKRILLSLKAISKAVKEFDRSLVCKIEFHDKKPIKIIFEHPELKLEHTLEAFVYEGKDITTGITLSYLIDALAFIPNSLCTISVYGDLVPIKIESNTGLTAIVMPAKLIK